MRGSSLQILLLALLLGVPLLLGAPLASRADTVFLKHGAKMEGHIVQRTDASVEIDIGAGTLTMPMSTVDRIEEGRVPLDDFEDRAREMDPGDSEGWLELAQWASREGLSTQSRQAYERVLAIDPENPEANRAMGRENVDGRWMTEDEANRARGLVQFEGQWMTPAEESSIVRSREAERGQAEAQARASEAEARQAEARERESEARARESNWDTSVVHWGTWGPGPTSWPSNATNPLDAPGQFGKGQ